jgi:hypothetical protein
VHEVGLHVVVQVVDTERLLDALDAASSGTTTRLSSSTS